MFSLLVISDVLHLSVLQISDRSHVSKDYYRRAPSILPISPHEPQEQDVSNKVAKGVRLGSATFFSPQSTAFFSSSASETSNLSVLLLHYLVCCITPLCSMHARCTRLRPGRALQSRTGQSLLQPRRQKGEGLGEWAPAGVDWM